MPCALLAKIAELRLPQHERGWTGVDAESVLESHHRVLRERELHTRNLSWSPRPMLSIGLTGLDVLEQYSTECLWLKVPRSTSWPLSRNVAVLARRAAGSSPGTGAAPE